MKLFVIIWIRRNFVGVPRYIRSKKWTSSSSALSCLPCCTKARVDNDLKTISLQACGMHHDNSCLHLLLSALFCTSLPSSICCSVSTLEFYTWFQFRFILMWNTHRASLGMNNETPDRCLGKIPAGIKSCWLYLDKDFILRSMFALQPSLPGLQPAVVQDFS